MFRKLTVLLTAVVVIFAMFPVLAASAAVTSTAQILSELSVFPDGIADDYQVEVNNNSDGLLGLGASDNLPVNTVQITLPPGLSAPACDTNEGWTCTPVSTGSTKRLVFQASGANLGIAEGQNFVFNFAATALSPGSRNRTESLQVQSSDDRGTTFSNSAATGRGLSITTRILQLLDQQLTVLNADLQPAGGADPARATTGQVAQVAFDVRSYAANPVTLRPSITTNASDTVRQPAADQTAAPQSTVTFTYLVDLGGTAGTRSGAMTVSAANTADPATNSGQVTLPLTVERAVSLAAAEGDFSPRRVAEGVVNNSPLTLIVDKDEVPAVTGLTGTIEFHNNDVNNPLFSATLATPATLTRPAFVDQPLTFEGIEFTVPGLAQELLLDARVILSGTDDNGQPYTQTLSLNDVLTIDALAPVVNLAPLAIVSPERRQERPNGDDAIRISGNVQNAADVPSPTGLVITVTVDGANYTMPAPLSGTGQQKTFSVDFSLVDRANSFGNVTAVGTATDSATNVGDDEEMIEYDALAPRLAEQALAVLDPQFDADPVIQVSFVEDFETPTVRGACSPLQWDMDNANVTEVRFSDGSPCTTEISDRGNDNIRILVLDRALDANNAGTVTYLADGGILGVGGDPAFDSANNRPLDDALRFIISAIQPAAPIIDLVTRTNATGEPTEGGRETMGFNDGLWHTNVAGPDATVFLDPANIVNTYRIRIFKEGVQVADVSADANDNMDRSVTGLAPDTCAAPCAAEDTVFQAQLVAPDPRGGELVSELTDFTIRYDTLVPGIADATAAYGNAALGQSDTVTVVYNEDLAGGQNSALDWSALTRNTSDDIGEANQFRAYGVNSVTAGDDLDRRDLSVDFNGDQNFAGVDFFNFEGFTYEDFAGNFSLDQLFTK